MPNYISFTTPASGTFTVSAGTDGQSPLYSELFSVGQAPDGGTVIKFYATGTTSPEIPQENLQVGTYYDVYAFESDGVTPKDVDWSGINIEFIDSFAYTADRRPIFQGGYATQTYNSTGDIKFGVNNQNYRKTPATGQSMTSTTTNGKLAWLTDKIKPAADRGFERFHITNIAGWTSDSDQGNNQPHFPSNSYTGLALTSAPMYVAQDSTVGAIVQATPFTDDGLSTGTPGDNEEAWAAGVTALKSWITGTPEITSYQGYRPVYTDNTMTTLRKDLLGYSKSSTNAAGWTGTGASPGFCPEPGFDGVGGFTTLPSTMAAWFDEEFIGLRSLGFDGIGLDTGTRVWDNSGGHANGTELGAVAADGTGDSALVDYFNTWGIKPVFEGVGLDTWTQGAGKSAAPATDGRYAASAYWAYFGSWWGYEGLANGEAVVTAHYDKASTGSVESPSGGYFFDTGLCGNAANAAAFGAEAEVHCIFQWGTGTYMSRIMQGTAGDAASGNGVGWTGMKQIMWDIRDAGGIVSAAGSMTTDLTVTDPNTAVAEVITWEMFLDYVTLLYTDPALVRPADSDATDWDTEPISYFYSAGASGEVPVTYIFNTTPWDTLQAAGGVAHPTSTLTSGASMLMATPVSGGWDSDAVATAFPHVYIWNTKYGSNNGWDKVTQTTSGNFKPNINFDGVNHAYAFDDNVPECVYAFYATDQGDISGWSAYNGPTS